MELELINDSRLTPTMERVRSGRTQLFRERSSNNKENITSDDHAISLIPKNKEMHADLIDGQWYWVNGCAECNGEERGFSTYIECEAHDVCESCFINRADVKEKSVWGGSKGWTCNTCKEARDLEKRREAFSKLDGEEPDCSYCNEIICPHCGSKLSSDDRHETEDIDCHVCEGEIHLEVEYTFHYSTTIKGKRITE